MTCEHLRELEAALIAAGIEETCRGQVWSDNCREWVYFRCVLDRPALRRRFRLADCILDHEHLGTHDGQEAGFVCEACHDAVMGSHPQHPAGPTFG
ncbi:MAG: hypothetical protein BIFFINMI_03594 [Phycisphaerae bacterium]|nr:hypothetical protein [Phycisphaerae bacterium]